MEASPKVQVDARLLAANAVDLRGTGLIVPGMAAVTLITSV